jgi:1-acyl-sn-glycerol-3-phosphate acyltransferase
MNVVSTTYPDCAVENPQAAAQKPESRLAQAARMGSILAMTTWTVGRIHAGGDPEWLMQRWIHALLRSLRVRIRVEGELQQEPQLWVSNHLSWLDPLVLMSLRPMGALAKLEVSGYPLIGKASRKAGLAFVDRADPTSRASALARLVADLRQGRSMLLFPEGTTTRGERLATLQEGGLRAAYRCRTPVQTLRLRSEDTNYPWIGEDELLPHVMTLVRAAQTRVLVQAGAVLEPWQFPTEESWIMAVRWELAP